MNKILIAHEKHGNRFFDASTEELRNKAALFLLTERFKDGFWYYEPEPPDSEGILTEEQIAALPTEALRNQEFTKLRQYKRAQKQYEANDKVYYQIEQAVKNKDATFAYKLLMSRTSYEYENITIEELEEI